MKRRDFAALTCLTTMGLLTNFITNFFLKLREPDQKSSGHVIVNVTVLFPRPMSVEEYTKVAHVLTDRKRSDELVQQMKATQELIQISSQMYSDRILTQLEFKNQSALDKYREKFNEINGDHSGRKKQLGFTTINHVTQV